MDLHESLSVVIDTLVDEKGLDRDQVVEIVREAIESVYAKRFPDAALEAVFNKKTSGIDVVVEKEVVSTVEDADKEVTLRKARATYPKAAVGQMVKLPFEGTLGRVEVIAVRQIISGRFRELEEQAIYEEFAEKEGKIVTGVVHKKERSGYAVSLGEATAFLPMSCSIPQEPLRVGYSIKALLKEVLPTSRGGYQLIIDRASPAFVAQLLELEIPEVFEGIVEIKKIVRSPGYKSKIALVSNSQDIDPVGTCVGVGGVRIKPILKGLGLEKIDLIVWTDDLESLIRASLKPAAIDEVRLSEDESSAVVAMAEDQRAFAIGKGGQNIALASQLTGVEIRLERLEENEGVDNPFENRSRGSVSAGGEAPGDGRSARE